jgi:hypothetical protein
VIAVCAMLSDADSFEDIALWSQLVVFRSRLHEVS